MIHAQWWCRAGFLAALLLVPAPGSAQRIKLTASLKDLESAARRDSNDASAHYNVALAYWNEKRWEDAERALQTSVSIEPQFAAAHLALSFLPYARRPSLFEEEAERRVPDEWKSAVEESDRHYRRAFVLDPLCDLRIAGAAVPGSAVALGPGADFFTEYFFDFLQGFRSLLEGDYEKGYVGFQRVFNLIDGDRHPDRVPDALHWFRGIAAAHAERWDIAEWDVNTLLTKALKLEEGDDIVMVPLETNELRYVLAALKHRAGRLDEALQAYQDVLENDVGLYMGNVQRARIYEAAQQWDQAIRERQAAVNANAGDPSLIYDLGVTLARGGRWADAERALAEAVALNGRDTRGHYYLGIARAQLGRSADARQSFERFIALAPSRYANQVADARRRLDALP
jgi:tetratricopeptide (TPR) repeat protein